MAGPQARVLFCIAVAVVVMYTASSRFNLARAGINVASVPTPLRGEGWEGLLELALAQLGWLGWSEGLPMQVICDGSCTKDSSIYIFMITVLNISPRIFRGPCTDTQ